MLGRFHLISGWYNRGQSSYLRRIYVYGKYLRFEPHRHVMVHWASYYDPDLHLSCGAMAHISSIDRLHLHEGRSVDIDRFTPEDQSISGWHLQEGRPVDIDRFTPPWRKTGRYQVYTSMKGDPSISGLHLHEGRPVDIDRFLPPWRESSIDRSPTQPPLACAIEKQTKASKQCALSLSLTLRLREHEVFVFVSYICMTKIKFQTKSSYVALQFSFNPSFDFLINRCEPILLHRCCDANGFSFININMWSLRLKVWMSAWKCVP